MRAPLAGVAALWLALGAVAARAVSDASGLCSPTADPCVVSTAIPVDDGAVLDLGARTLEVLAEGLLDVGPGTMTISAGAVVLRPEARLAGSGGRIVVNTSGAIRTEAASRIDVSAALGGLVNLRAGGDVTVGGVLDAHSSGGADGGLVAASGATVTLAEGARIVVRGDAAAGGSVSLVAAGPLEVDAPIDAAGGESGGAIEFDAASVRLGGRIDVSGGPGGAGAIIDIRARGPVVVNGNIDGDARGGVLTGGGLGAELSIFAQGNVDLNGRISLTGGAPGGEGGLVDIVATGDVTQRGTIQTRGNGTDGVGGEVRITTDGGLTLADIDIGGGLAANRVLVASQGVVRLTGVISGEPASGSGFGGVVDMTACVIDMDSTARVSTLGREGRNALTVSGQIIIRGTLEAGAENAFRIRDAALPPVLLGSVSPAPTTTVDPALPPCEIPVGPGTTTTTLVVAECADPFLTPYDTLLCRLSALRVTLADASPATLGGRRTARSLRRRAARALRAIEVARTGRRIAQKLEAASVQLARFGAGVQRRLDRGRIEPTLGARLLDLASTAAAQIEALRL